MQVSNHSGQGGPLTASPFAAIMAAWTRHNELLGNAISLFATSVFGSALGFFYWTVAARLFAQRAVGYGSAAVSAMTLLGTFGMFGLGTVLIGELPRRRRLRAGLVSAALFTTAGLSLVLGIGFALIAPDVSSRLANIGGTVSRVALFATGVALSAVTMVFDQATIGLLRGGLQLLRNISFAAAKLIMLPISYFYLRDVLGLGIILSWTAGTALSVLPVAIRIKCAGSRLTARPDWAVLRGLGKAAISHNWLNLAMAAPTSMIPVLVTIAVSPSANAVFYAAWMLANFLYLIPLNLSTVLFAVAVADPPAAAKKIRFTLRLSIAIGVPGMIALGFGADLALSLFGPGYAKLGTVPLLLLVAGYIPAVPRAHYVAICRARGYIVRAALLLTVAAAVELAAAAAGGKSGGLAGLSLALLAVRLIEGVVTAPTVLRAALTRGRHRRSGRAAAGACRAAGSAVGTSTPEQAGLAAIVPVTKSLN